MADIDILADEQFDRWLSDPERQTATIVGLDLTDRPASIADIDLRRSLFVGCQVTSKQASALAGSACTVISQVGTLPIPVGRASMYRVADLYSDFDPASEGSWNRTLDYAAWSWFMDSATNLPRPHDAADLVAARIHDATVEGALTRTLTASARPIVGVMGGHDTPRSKPLYGDIARLARQITLRGRLIITGGGPGLMEAANLGAFMAPYDEDELDAAIETLAQADDFKSHEWLATACAVRSKLLGDWRNEELPGSFSVGIPTWLYGNEPPNMFSTRSAKLFFNSVREDGLVTMANGGILFAEGNAGTVQEIFQDATQNYYRKTGEGALPPTPMVLFGAEYWSRPCDSAPDLDPATGTITDKRKPLLPLLNQLAAEKVFSNAVIATSDLAEALERLAPDRTEEASSQTLAWRQN